MDTMDTGSTPQLSYTDAQTDRVTFGLLGVAVIREVFQDLLHAISQSLKAGKLHPRIDAGSIRAHLTHQVDLTKI